MTHEDLLRRALEAEAAKVEVGMDALPEIRRRIAARRPWWRGRPVFFAGTFAAVAVAAVAVGVVSCEPTRSTAPPLQPGGSQTTPAPTPTTSPAPPPSQPAGQAGPTGGSPAGGQAATLGVYYLGRDEPRLYREFRRLATGDGSPAAKARAAVTEMLAGKPRDPDYSSPWPASARVRDVRLDGDVVTVDLAGVDNPTQAAVQQLVWTATAASGRSNVRLLLDGAPFAMQRRAPAADTLALIWLINPQHGETVKRTFEVHVYGSVFEATVNLRVRQGDRVVTETTVMLNVGAPAFGEARKQLTLAPGRYTIEAYEISARDGSEQHLDDHAVTVS
jgi:hypothetical protein